jgi:phosphoserine phosphatase
MDKKGLAVFDFDGTLIRFDGLRLILLLCAITMPLKLFWILAKKGLGRKIAGRTRSEDLLVRLLKGRSEGSVATVLAPYRFLCRIFRRLSVWEMLEKRKAIGLIPIIATASPAFAVRWSVDDLPVIGHDFEILNSVFSGIARNRQPYGEEKRRQVEAYAATQGRVIEESFSDSMSDAPLFRISCVAYKIGSNGVVKRWKEDISSDKVI